MLVFAVVAGTILRVGCERSPEGPAGADRTDVQNDDHQTVETQLCRTRVSFPSDNSGQMQLVG